MSRVPVRQRQQRSSTRYMRNFQRKYEAALQEIEYLRSELEVLKRERSAAQPLPTGGAEGAPGSDLLQVGNAHFVAQQYAEAIAAYTKAIEAASHDSRAYTQPGVAH